MIMYYVLAGVLSLVGMFVSSRLKSKFAHYAQFGLRANLTGAEVADKMLRHYGIHDVQITMGRAFFPTTTTRSRRP